MRVFKLLRPLFTKFTVESGTDNGWTYEKYNDGTFEASIKVTLSKSTANAVGNVYYRTLTDIVALPSFYNTITNILTDNASNSGWMSYLAVSSNRALSGRLLRASSAAAAAIIYIKIEGTYTRSDT